MDLRTVVIITALLLTAAAANPENTTSNNVMDDSKTKSNNMESPTVTPETNATSASASTWKPLPPVLSFLTIQWTSSCKGHVILHHPSSLSYVCYDQHAHTTQTLLRSPCLNKRGCKDPETWGSGQTRSNGSIITEAGAERRSNCYSLTITCAVVDDNQGQLRTYKVMVGLLCCVLLVIVLIRFTRPTVQALQRRFSDKRQNRWIGPTQSHSVSYNRGKTVNDGEKRLSYPGLERLTVSDSREPSSNRNSGFNF